MIQILGGSHVEFSQGYEQPRSKSAKGVKLIVTVLIHG